MMINPHDVYADFFDMVYKSFKNDSYSQKELDFIRSKIPQHASVLDLGCGTGRHLIPLAKAGFKMTGIDSSKKLAKIAQEKLEDNQFQVKIICEDINKLNELEGKFNAAICFWNSFCEMAQTAQQANHIFRLLHRSLNDKGILILEQSNLPFHDINHLEFHTKHATEKESYGMSFKIASFDQKTRISKARQTITMKSQGKSPQMLSTIITQRWWNMKELEALARKAGFKKVTFYGGDFNPFKEPTDKIILVAEK